VPSHNAKADLNLQFDDFIVTHVQQTLTIHFTGNFQPWHRWFVYVYERALRDECGYKGYQPVCIGFMSRRAVAAAEFG